MARLFSISLPRSPWRVVSLPVGLRGLCPRRARGKAACTRLTVACEESRMHLVRRRFGYMTGVMKRRLFSLLAGGVLVAGVAPAEVCTTQSAMTATDRDALAAAARGLA